MPPPTHHQSNETSSSLPFILLFFFSMIGHELALESLSTTYTSFVHLADAITIAQFGFCVLLPLLVSYTCIGDGDVRKSFPKSRKEFWIYVKLSAIVYGATACATRSLSYAGVTYVTKVVFKSAKLIPTMIVGVIMDKRKKYGPMEYLSAFLLCLGAAGFCMSPKDFENGEDDKMNVDDQAQDNGHWIGIALLTTSVFCDALVPNIQQQLMQGNGSVSSSARKSSEDEELELKSLIDDEEQHDTQTKQQQVAAATSSGLSAQALMVNTNSIGFSLLLLTTIFRRSFIPILIFSASHPHFLLMSLAVGIGLGSAVLAYTELIRRSGPTFAVAIATLRKVVTVVLSYIIFPKPMSAMHAISAVLVMGGIVVGYKSK
jgi:adenosine 3'-phospho 5'-phosphosulfate transporter B3